MNNIILLKNNIAPHIEITKYPDGQQNVIVDLDYYDVKTPIIIKCRIKNFAEFEILLCIIKALQRNDRIIKQIDFKYLYGLRSDRSFSCGDCNYVKDILRPILNSLFPITINIYYAHSENAIYQLSGAYEHHHDYSDPYSDHILKHTGFIPIAADQSAKKSKDFIHCAFSKLRCRGNEIDIRLSEMERIYILNEPKHSDILLIDDLCDGGATFIAEAEYLKRFFPDRKLYLFVAHGLFTKGLEHVAKHFEHVYTTNSYQDFEDYEGEKLTVIDVWS